jgi:hypothetical protein
MRNPFSDDIFTGELNPKAEVESVNAETLEKLSETVPVEGGPRMGRALVVSAPRAGFGKTHLVTRFAANLHGKAVVVPLRFDLEKEPRWQTVLWDLLEKLHRDQSHRAGLTLLDEAARFLFARVNQRLIETQRIPCTHPAEAVAALERNYLEMFDFADPNQEVAKWFGEHFERLTPMTSDSLAPAAAIDPTSVIFCLRVLMAYAQSAGEPPDKRLESLRWAVNTSSAAAFAPGGAMAVIQESGNAELSAKEKLRDFARVLGLYRPFVFVIDHLDVFFRDGRAGLKIAYFVSELRRLIPRSLIVICVNEDLWEATFRSQLPSALEDRMSGGFLHLRGIDPGQAADLVGTRVAEAGVAPTNIPAFLEFAKIGDLFALNAGRPVSPRAVLRYAAERWENFLNPQSPPSSMSPPSAPPPLPVPPAPPQPFHSPEPPLKIDQASPFIDLGEGSLIGDETLDSIAQALDSMTPAERHEPFTPSVPLAPPPESRSAFQDLKERLESIHPPRSMPEKPAPKINGTVPNDPASIAYAENFRRQISAPLSTGLDWERLADLLRFAGEQSPAVRFNEVAVPGATGVALQWLSPDAETLFGLEPATRPTFWSALVSFAGTRARQNGGLPVKVVVFGEKITTPHPAASAWQPGGSPFALDLVETTPADLAAISAATDLIKQADSGAIAASPADVAAVLARELDLFWRRLTRLPATTAK